MRPAFTLSLCALLSVSPVLADPPANATVKLSVVAADTDACGWSASMEEDEGGPTMVASSCASDTESGPAFRLFCGDEVNIRYDGNGLGLGANPPASSTLVLTSGGKSLTADLVYEEMDGAFAAYVELGSPIISLLKTGSEVDVALRGVDVPSRKVSLNGSAAAISELIDACT